MQPPIAVSPGAPAPATNLDDPTILRIASDAAAKLGLAPGQNLEMAVRGLGGRVQSVPRGAQALGDARKHATLSVFDRGRFEIRIPDDVGEYRRRYLVAHELGHYLLHYPLSESTRMDAAYIDSSRAEHEADVFARGFLIPSDALREAHVHFRGVNVDIAEHFAVSVDLLERRYSEVGLSTD